MRLSPLYQILSVLLPVHFDKEWQSLNYCFLQHYFQWLLHWHCAVHNKNTSTFQENWNAIFTLHIPEIYNPWGKDKTLGHWNTPQTDSASYLVRWLIYPRCLPKTQYWVMEPSCQRCLIFLSRRWIYSKKGVHISLSIPWVASTSLLRQPEQYLKYHIKIIRIQVVKTDSEAEIQGECCFISLLI